MKLSGWGRYPVLDCRLERLREGEGLSDLLDRTDTLIARGNGRSYGDAALNPDLTLSMLAMDRMHAFDTQTGLLTCEAGVLLADILDVFVPRGWIQSSGLHILYSRPVFLWVICPVLLYWLGRLTLLANRGAVADDPVVFAVRDRVSWLTGLDVLTAFAAAL